MFKALITFLGFGEKEEIASEIVVREKTGSEANSSQAVILEKKESKPIIKMATYEDLREMARHSPPLPAVSEYPPQPRLVPAITIDEIMAIYAKSLRETAEDMSLTEDEVNDHFLPIVRRATSYMHLLPASQFNHHSGVGGLFAHSLQVGKVAERMGKRKVFNRRETPRQLYHNGKRWLFGCWLAGFLHDIGKLGTDVTVTSDGETWYARAESLMSWLELNNHSEYSFVWKSAGHNKHQEMTMWFVKEIVQPKTLYWLAEFGSLDIWLSCENALNNPAYKGENGMIAEVVMQADRLVSGEDLRKRNSGEIDTKRLGGSLPAAEFILDAIRLMVSEKTLMVNEKGSFLFVTNAGTFIIWTEKTAEKIYQKLLQERHTSVPKNVDRMLDCLIYGEAVEPSPNEISEISNYYWPVVLELFPHSVFRCVKLRSNYSIFSGLVAPDPLLAMVNGCSEQDPELVKAWVEKFGRILDDKALEDKEIPISDEAPAEPNASGTSEALPLDYDKTMAESDVEADSKESEEELRGKMMPPSESDVQSEQEVKNESPTADTGLPVDSSATAAPAAPAAESSQGQVVENAQDAEKQEPSPASNPQIAAVESANVAQKAEKSSEKAPGEDHPSMDERSDDELMKMMMGFSSTDADGGESTDQSETSLPLGEEKEEVVDDSSKYYGDTDAVLKEEVYQKKEEEQLKTFETKKQAQKEQKRLETIAKQAQEDAEQDEVSVVYENSESKEPEQVVQPTQPQSAQTSWKTEAENVSKLPLPKRLFLMRSWIINALLTADSSVFPEGVLKTRDEEYQGLAERVFDRAEEFGLERAKVEQQLTYGFQPGDWILKITRDEEKPIVSITKRKQVARS